MDTSRLRAGRMPHRPDIQGLRALAVLLVIADHVFGRPIGGFIGVDVFFVVSGYLVTVHLLRERRHGQISPRAFYRNRVRRIAPVAVTALVVTCGAAWWAFSQDRARSTSFDGLASLVLGANVRFASLSTDPFATDGATSPLLHYWSLMVAGQFYLGWPLLLLGLWVATRRSERATWVVAGVAMAVVVGASFTWAVVATDRDSAAAYFSSLTRVWELGAGALLAIVAPRFERWLVTRTLLSWAGMVVIGAGVFAISEGKGFPGPWGAVAVVGTLMVLAAGTAGPQPRNLLLTNSVARYVGDLSFSLYVWHFPVLVFLDATMRDWAGFEASVLVLTFVIAAVSHHGIEQPALNSSWLTDHASPRRQRNRARPVIPDAIGVVAAGTVVAVMVGTFAFALAPEAPSPRSAPAPLVPSDPGESQPSPADPAQDVVEPDEVGPEAVPVRLAEIEQSLTATSWPELTPPLADLRAVGLPPEWVDDGCLAYADNGTDIEVAALLDGCAYGDESAPRLAFVVGDESAISWVPGLRQSLGTSWRIQVVTAAGCPFYEAPVRRDGVEYPGCAGFLKRALYRIRTSQPDLVIATSLPGNHPPGASVDVAAAVAATLTKYRRASSAVVALLAPPPGPDLGRCKTSDSVPDDCVTRPKLRLHFQIGTGASRARVSLLEPSPLFCVDTWCPAFIDGIVVYAARSQLTADASRAVGPALVQGLKQTLLADSRTGVANALGQ